MKKFITFGGPKHNYYNAAKRLVIQARSLDLFDQARIYKDEYLKKQKDFWSSHSNFIENNKRGYGFWIWKPYIIKKTMETMKEGDVLMYLDCGCELDINKKAEISKFLELVKEEILICTQVNIEKNWTKMDLIKKLEIDKKHLDSPQHQGGVLLFLICDKTIELVNEWYELACDYHNIDDTPSKNKNLKCFIEHRHDQSIISLLIKKKGLCSNKYSLYDCVEILRNASGISKIQNKNA